jgi:hypothetical protein
MHTTETKAKNKKKSSGNDLLFVQTNNNKHHELSKLPPNSGILSPSSLIQKKEREQDKADPELQAQQQDNVTQEKKKEQDQESIETQSYQTTQKKSEEGEKKDVVQGGFWSKVKKAGAWLKDKAAIIKWLKSAGLFAKSLWELVKAKKWTDAYAVSKEGQKPPGALAKLGAVYGLVTGPITIGKAIINIVKSNKNKNLIKEGKKPNTDKEKKAKENITGIQNVRLTMAAASATDGVLSIISSIMTLAGAATAGIGAIVAVVIEAVQLIMSGAKLIYNEYRKRSSDYKAKIQAENDVTAEGMISLKDASLYNVIGMQYDEGSGKLSEDKQGKSKGIKDKLDDFKRDFTGGKKEQEEVDQSQQKGKIIEHLNKERDDAASA